MTTTINLLAQATQPISSWRTWDAATWLFFIGGVVSIIVAAWAKIQSANAQNMATHATKTADNAQTTATTAASTASAAKAATDVNTARVTNIGGQVFDVAKAMTPAAPPAPTPEAIASGLAANQPPENKP